MVLLFPVLLLRLFVQLSCVVLFARVVVRCVVAVVVLLFDCMFGLCVGLCVCIYSVFD